jgi:hypothetical protein
MICDGIDSIIPQLKYGWDWVKKPTFVTDGSTGVVYECHSEFGYQMSDKMLDTILVAIVIMFHLVRVGGFVTLFEVIFVILFAFRLIGVLIFELTGVAAVLAIFPDFVLTQTWLYILLVYVLKMDGWPLWTIMALSIILKYAQEIGLHVISVPLNKV